MADGVSGAAQASEPVPAVLTDAEVRGRVVLLGELQAALDRREVQAVMARHHRLVLSGKVPGYNRSGMTDPVLHVFARSGDRKVTTDGESFVVDDGTKHPVSGVVLAASAIANPPDSVPE